MAILVIAVLLVTYWQHSLGNPAVGGRLSPSTKVPIELYVMSQCPGEGGQYVERGCSIGVA
jgi:hypothetical protein